MDYKPRIPFEDWPSSIASRVVNYARVVVSKARRLTWRQVKAGTPPPHLCGRIPAAEIASGIVRELVLDPSLREELVLNPSLGEEPAEQWPAEPPQACVNASSAD